MRDILVTAIVFGLLPFVFKRPQIGVMLWVWISVMNPHRLGWGFAYDFNFALIIAVVTLLSALASKDLKPPPMNAVTVTLFLFVAWTGVSTMFALYPEESFETWKGLMKTQLMAILIPMLFHKKEDLRWLIWVIVISIAYYGAKGGLFVLTSGGGHRVYGPPNSYIEENNALAVAVVMTIPLMRYLQQTSPDKRVRWGILGVMLLSVVAVIGSYSRGALLAVVAMGAVLWWKGRQKLPLLLAAILLAPLLLAFMPEEWFKRMDTMTTYEADTSASARLNAWTTMVNIANDRPLVGGGFSVAKVPVYQVYAPDRGQIHQIAVAHSIYFQALGEHGYVGLGLYLLLFFSLWRSAGRIVRVTRDRADLAWARDLSAMMQVSIAGFAVGGAFLSLVNFDVPYYLVGVMVATRALVERELKAQTSAPPPPNAPGSSARIRRNPSPRPGIG